MLSEIYCDVFYQKKIIFNQGLSVVLGTNAGDNSIGKSTFLLIVDYAFGGTTYAETTDIINNVGSHDIFFTFTFGENNYTFCRNILNVNQVWKCSATREKTDEITREEYCKWLDSQYAIKLQDLSFRDAVGRYIRVYGKNNCDEKHPLHYFAREENKKACDALVKLFDAYSPMKEAAKAATASEADLKTYKKAQTLKFIAKISSKEFSRNQKAIEDINSQLCSISDNLEQGLLSVDAEASEQAIYLKRMLSRARSSRSKLINRKNMLEDNGTYVFSATTDNFSELAQFFPNVEIAHLSEIESFHRTISAAFKSELKSERAKIEKEISEYDLIIDKYEQQLRELISNPNLSKIILSRHAELLREKERMEQENCAYTKLKQLKENHNFNKKRLLEVKREQFATVSYQINEEMSKLNDAIYEGSYNAPVLDFTDNGYIFFTPDDTGTGIAYKGLVVYDLAVLGLTKLPILVHDSVVLKQISDDAIEHIVDLYSSCGKQVIIALDKQSSYSDKTSKMLSDAAVLQLSDGGKQLFGRSWG